jgi:hypothetical protein
MVALMDRNRGLNRAVKYIFASIYVLNSSLRSAVLSLVWQHFPLISINEVTLLCLATRWSVILGLLRQRSTIFEKGFRYP